MCMKWFLFIICSIRPKKANAIFPFAKPLLALYTGAKISLPILKERLGLNPGETTPDGKFSLSVVECLGACETAPMMQVNKEYTGCLNKKKIDELIDKNS